MIVPMKREHAARVAEIHCAALAGDFLPSLGKEFLTVFYQGVFDLGVGFGFVVMEDNQLVGFVLGSADTSSLFKQIMMSKTLALGWRVFLALCRHPKLIFNVLETFLYPSKENVAEKAELVVIGFDAAYRGRGLGSELVDALNAEFRAQGVRSYKVTVLQSNQRANNFYLKRGFRCAKEFVLYRKNWNLYTKTI